MRTIRILGWVSLVLGMLVVGVAISVSVDQNQLALEPLFLGLAAILAGVLSLRKGGKKPEENQ